MLDLLPRTVPVLACTATANDRVVDDVKTQLGEGLSVFRGPLARDGLALQVVGINAPAARLAWLAQTIPRLPGSGIVYCLTKRDVEAVAEWLRTQGLTAETYTGASEGRESIEQALLSNDVDVVVATSALGMGFDKPDLAYVIHFQAPGSVVAYYQQVGRAGRQLPSSYGVLLRGAEDTDIQDWFISTSFPTAEESAQVVAALEQHDGFMKLTELEAMVNVRPSRIELLMKNLEVDGIVVADGKKYQRTPRPFIYDAKRPAAITGLGRAEQVQMEEYGELESGCRMEFLAAALDDPYTEPCGVCDLCAGPALAGDFDPALAGEAAEFLRQRPVVISPRKQWPDRKHIPDSLQLLEGRALSRWGDGGWSELVKRGKQVDGHFDQRLVDALAGLIVGWHPDPKPTWITWVPSLNHTTLVPDLARRLGVALGLPTVAAVVKSKNTRSQKNMENSAQQLANIKGAFAVNEPLPRGPALLVDDIVDSRWTLSYVGSLLLLAGCDSVMPVVLSDSGHS